MASAQVFISVSDLVEDQQTAGANESRWYQAIRDASDYLQKRIGWFIPNRMTRRYNGRALYRLMVHPLLSVTEIINDGTTLTGVDYLFQPDARHWNDGPHTSLLVDPDAENISNWVAEDDGVEITGAWGLYSKSVNTGALINTTQTSSAETLVVNNGGKVSPGMVLLIGSEQELVTGWDDPTASVTALNGAITVSDSVLTVNDGTLLKKGEILRVEFEQMKVKDIRGNQVAVIRDWNGSGKAAHADDAAVDVYRTVTVERAVNGTTAAEHTSTTSILRYVTPDDIQFLTREIATLMLNKAKSGYQGRSGNAETGTVFYNDALPEFEINKVAENYRLPVVR